MDKIICPLIGMPCGGGCRVPCLPLRVPIIPMPKNTKPKE